MRRAAPAVPQRHFVAFRIGEGEIAFDVHHVTEVLRHGAVTPLPEAPPFLQGMMDVRGTLVPVVDLRRRLEVAEPRNDAETRVIILTLDQERVGVVVDRVTEVVRVPETEVTAPPAFVRGRVAGALSAVVRIAERTILVLDVDRLLTTEERIALRDLEAIREQLVQGAPADAEVEGRDGT
jgi:purine-binding chemotaxis protein CheW